MTNPLVFISHKHSDNAIAGVVSSFIRDKSLGNVKVFMSSDWKFNGPRFGAGLNSELQRTLWDADVLILVYTSADQDWSFCMWECGVAAQPDSPNTNVVVFQCGRDVPTPFASDLRVDVRSIDHVRRFTKQLLTAPDFFPNLKQALAPNISQATLEEASQELFSKFKAVLPEEAQAEEWPAWPFMRIELPKSQIETLEAAIAADRVKMSHEIVKEYAVVVKSDARAAQLFGVSYISDRQEFKKLLKAWEEAYPTSDATWFDSCCAQIMVSARRGFPIIQWTPLREVGGESDFTPVLSRVKRIPFGGSVQFDIFFYNLSDPQAVPATSRMIPISNFFYKKLAHAEDASAIKLKALVGEIKARGLDRVPILNAELHALYIIHRNMIDKFVVDNIWGGASVTPDDITLAGLLAESDTEKEFENFVVIKKQATLAEARDSMRTTPGCLDVFVTEHGRWDEPVLGWLTDVDIARSN